MKGTFGTYTRTFKAQRIPKPLEDNLSDMDALSWPQYHPSRDISLSAHFRVLCVVQSLLLIKSIFFYLYSLAVKSTHLLRLPPLHQTFTTPYHQLLFALQLQSQPQPCLVAVLTSVLDISTSKRLVDLVLQPQAQATQMMLSPKPSTTSANSSTRIEAS